MITTLAVIILAAVVVVVLLLMGVLSNISAVANRSQQQIYAMAEHEGRTDAMSRTLKTALEKTEQTSNTEVSQVREEVSASLKAQADALQQRLADVSSALQRQQSAAEQHMAQTSSALERLGRASAEEAARERAENAAQAKLVREEVARNLKTNGDALMERVAELTVALRNQQFDFHQQMGRITQNSDRRIAELQQLFEQQLRRFEDGVDARLDQMRSAVDDQVQLTLDRGLGESFRQVRQRLDAVQQNLAEMQSLASNVGDLRRVLTNVSRRGNWGVVRLSSLLEGALSTDQYAADVKTRRGSEDRVQFAVRLPGREPGDDKAVWLPIDAGVSLAMYQRLIDARDGSDAAEIEEAGAAMEAEIRSRAQSIREKFIDPPATTDFAVMFLPVEGLYAEVLRRDGLAEEIQRDSRVVVSGPTTLSALLNSLQMGFRTLVLEQRSLEVWRLLSAVKGEFDGFGRVLGDVQAKLQEASSTISTVESHAREMQQKLGDVRELRLDEAIPAFASAALPAAAEATDPAATPEPEPVRVNAPAEPSEPTVARFE